MATFEIVSMIKNLTMDILQEGDAQEASYELYKHKGLILKGCVLTVRNFGMIRNIIGVFKVQNCKISKNRVL